jgi:hypothetical protein
MPKPIHFTDSEIALMFDAALFERKRIVNQKIFTLFENIRIQLKDSSLHKQFPFLSGVDVIGGKISQGENYLGCPWVMLDFPKMFNKDAIFAYRTMFWYGHYLSASMLIAGEQVPTYLPKLIAGLHLLPPETYFSLHPDPWHHAIDEGSAIRLNTIKKDLILTHVNQNGYFKLSRKWTGSDFETIANEVVTQYEKVLETLL